MRHLLSRLRLVAALVAQSESLNGPGARAAFLWNVN